MPLSESFAYNYGFGTINPATNPQFLGTAATVGGGTLTDSQDGAADGFTDVGDTLTWSLSGSPATYHGRTNNGEPIVSIVLDEPYYYILSNDPNHGSETFTVDSSPYPYCFAEGTGIATPGGERPVQDLAAGDLVLTADGRAVPVLWLGRQSLSSLFSGTRAGMVRIRAGALGDGLPHADLEVTGEHGMIVDGHVINASALVNGTSIDFVPMGDLPETFTVYHVETEAHDVILANGARSETFIDYRGRRAFDNCQEYMEIYGAERIIPEMHRPRISSARHLPDEIANRLGIQSLAGFPEDLPISVA